MTAKAALCLALLEGRVLNVKNCFETIGLTNIGREIPRMVEEPFNVIVSRTSRTGKSRYGQLVSYTDYRLNKSEHNLEGMAKMKEYVQQHLPKSGDAKTTTEKKRLQQTELLFHTMESLVPK